MKPPTSNGSDSQTKDYQPRAQPDPLSVDDQIGKQCELFDQAWRQGARPKLDVYVREFPAEGQPRLLGMLLEIELNHRVRCSEVPALADYQALLPEHSSHVALTFADRTLDTFFLGQEIGQGGMGRVHMAIHMKLGRLFAIKLMRNDQGAERFLREMRLIGGLIHPNIVRADHADQDRHKLFIAMELIDGWNLAEFVRKHHPLEIPVACELIRQATVGLDYIHERKLVHRDIKPQNLMLDHSGVVKILDLGLGRLQLASADDQGLSNGIPVGTLDYMSPEHILNPRKVDIRSDIYSLGCTFFYLLTGRPPFPESEHIELDARLDPTKEMVAPLVSKFRPDVPEEVTQAVHRALAKSPDDRFQRPIELTEAIKHLACPSSLQKLIQIMQANNGAEVLDSPRRNTASLIDPLADTRGNRRAHFFSRQPIQRRRWIAAGFALAASCAAAVGGWRFLNKVGGSDSEPPAPPKPPAGQEAPVEQEPLAELKRSLALQAGPGGTWWFDEIPQFNPMIRRLLLNSPKTDFDALRQLLDNEHPLQIAAKLRLLYKENQSALRDDQAEFLTNSFVQATAGDFRTDNDFLASLQKSHEKMVERWPALGTLTEAAAHLPPEHIHFYAVVSHKIATLSRGKDRDEPLKRAAEAYRKAINSYPKEDSDQKSFCTADFAMLMLECGEKEESHGRFFDAEPSTDSSGYASFLVYTLCCQAQTLYPLGRHDEAVNALDRAERLLRDRDQLRSPLFALVQEQRAWTYLERWSELYARDESSSQPLDTAKECFEAAMALRENHKSNSPTSLVLWVHDRHGLALVEQYSSLYPESRASLSTLVGDINGLLGDKTNPPSLYAQRELKNRRFNAWERMAESYLYQLEPGPDFASAIETYNSAIRAAQEDGLDKGRRLLALTRVYCKLSIAQSLNGNAIDARQSYEVANKNNASLTPKEMDLVKLLLDVAHVLVESQSLKDAGANLKSHVSAFFSNKDNKVERDDRRVLDFLRERLLPMEKLL